MNKNKRKQFLDFNNQNCYNNYSSGLIADTKKIYEPFYNKQLNNQEANEIINNMANFFKVLHEVKQDNESAAIK